MCSTFDCGRGFVDDAVELLRDRRARSRRSRRHAPGADAKRGAQRGEAARESTRPRQLPARQSPPTWPRPRPRRLRVRSTARHVVVGDRVEVDALTAGPDRRQQIVRGAGDEHHDRAVRRLLERLQHRVRGLVLVPAQALGLEQHQHFALAFDRRACRFGKDALAHVVLDAIRSRARFELHDVGMHAAHHEPQAAFVVGDADEHRRELTRRVFDARAAWSDEQVRVAGPGRGLPQRAERPLLTDDDRVHAGEPTERPRRPRRGPGPRPLRECHRRRRSPSRGPGARSRYAARTSAWNAAPARSKRSRSAETRASAIESGRSSTMTRSGSTPAAAHLLDRSTSSTPRPRAAPW